ncbi:MAG: hypothetical protein EA398_13260 [Deltaproteobacteria bacterium]|nr:MAG: hypothetical protein EA398_13260 [Deltaproteobacteria bacterium]
MLRLLLGLLVLTLVAVLAVLALGVTPNPGTQSVQQTLVDLDGLPEPSGTPESIRLLVLDAAHLHALPRFRTATARPHVEEAVREFAGQAALRRADIIVVLDWPLDGSALHRGRTLQLLAYHNNLHWQAGFALLNRRRIPAFAPPELPRGAYRGGPVILSRFPIESVHTERHAFAPHDDIPTRLWGAPPGILDANLRIGPEQTLDVRVLDRVPHTDHDSHDGILVGRAPLPLPPDAMPSPTGLSRDDRAAAHRGPVAHRNDDGTLVVLARDWAPVIGDGSLDLEGRLPSPALLIEMQRRPPVTPQSASDSPPNTDLDVSP